MADCNQDSIDNANDELETKGKTTVGDVVIEGSATVNADCTFTCTDCTVGGVKVTAENFKVEGDKVTFTKEATVEGHEITKNQAGVCASAAGYC